MNKDWLLPKSICPNKVKYDLIIVGGGAAGFFTALNVPSNFKVLILEKDRRPLQKVKVSGGGRCNLTHHCFDPEVLCQSYPRGSSFLLEPFKRFNPTDTVNWFEKRGVRTKTESDGRMFPVSDSSQSVIDCFLREMRTKSVQLELSSKVVDFSKEGEDWLVETEQGNYTAHNLVLATGSEKRIWDRLAKMGIEIAAPVPSLFTFQIEDKELHALAGISFEKAALKMPGFRSEGPLLITHWGFSGPAVLKLSAFGALALHEKNYQFDIQVDWLQDVPLEKLNAFWQAQQETSPKKKVRNTVPPFVTKRFWEYVCDKNAIGEYQNWSETGKKHKKALNQFLKGAQFKVVGKSTFKEEFVTAGGVELHQIDSECFGLKEFENLYMAGEILNIDALTGGFNFQAAWTAAWHIAKSVGEKTVSQKK
ncbi:NAD(P)/FAD-dependent oxidoreductase [Marinilongibacter aquaticus]|uniref:NAD(P)/FAD-dependent oxidoreductase n=1 Tax=Marinilongibacter aquaticus TaxID=2975157 RepID=UPI0021BDED47|nr:NAD(P)/FAD-dependent oxidoreductase [Marinilongibacter aquaticus]UBM59710.1 NAD(P)/FAD-dependent oxidoreductase [Marinilongibacter aquaticus]